MSDSVLRRHVRVLDEAGYVRVRKAVVASRQRICLALAAGGRRALTGHVAELQRLLAPATEAVVSTDHPSPNVSKPAKELAKETRALALDQSALLELR